MPAIVILIMAIAAIFIGYGLYAKNIDTNVIQPDDSKATPAKMFMDGVDFIPANRNVLFGYQFKSIAALGPIVGPIVALRWGWLPALLWVLLGTFFIGWVQDYSSIIVGVREEGQTFGALSYRFISPRARNILLIFIYCYLLLIMGAFGKIVGYDLMTNPAVPFGVFAVIVLGVLAGQMTYKWKVDIIITSIITVVLSFAGIWTGAFVTKGFFADLNASLGGSLNYFWTIVVLVICYLGAVLAIWRWAQPINYVAFWIVFLGILGGYIGFLIWFPNIPADFPAFTNWDGILYDPKTGEQALGPLGWLWPVLFVTIACGAISGWHSLVSTSGTARQLEKESDALPVGGGAMFLEMFLATLALMTGLIGVGAITWPGKAEGEVVSGFGQYVSMVAAGKNAGVFALGLSQFLKRIGIDPSFGTPYGSVFLTLMALTIMYLVVRFMRVASAEFLGDAVPALKNVHVGSIVALILSAILIFTGFWSQVWVLFGGANQLMASLALLIVSLWLRSKGKNYMWTFIPFIFMFVTTIGALITTVVLSLPNLTVGAVIADVLAVILIICALILAYDSIVSFSKPVPEEAKAS
ncbi:MAG: carbon starvation CstA family protein [Anaerolineae bacterium]